MSAPVTTRIRSPCWAGRWRSSLFLVLTELGNGEAMKAFAFVGCICLMFQIAQPLAMAEEAATSASQSLTGAGDFLGGTSKQLLALGDSSGAAPVAMDLVQPLSFIDPRGSDGSGSGISPLGWVGIGVGVAAVVLTFVMVETM